MTIDSQLNFDQHVDDLCKKLAERITVLQKIRCLLPLDRRIFSYNAMVKQVPFYDEGKINRSILVYTQISAVTYPI